MRDKETGKHRGYAFIVYEREKDMKGIETKDSPSILLPPHIRMIPPDVKRKKHSCAAASVPFVVFLSSLLPPLISPSEFLPSYPA